MAVTAAQLLPGTFGGDLQELGLIEVPARLTIQHGADLGRPGTIVVDVPASRDSGICVSRTAVRP